MAEQKNINLSHVGGHLNITHQDAGAINWLKWKGCKTLLDIGCSVGGQIDVALQSGLEAYGIDGDYSLTTNPKTQHLNRIYFNDLTKTYITLPIRFDAIWCCEVAEHIEEQYVGNLMKTISENLLPGGILVFTSNEGPGINHVNCKPQLYWIALLDQYGLKYFPEYTLELRTYSTMEREFIKNTGNVFIKV
jgi:2-polyprenyl-3-methyl-5-hydroxy-6-metoxy-1,4-benzoquinol methylase